jgi:uncharacterized protein YndB with AHSA1/START domain
MAKGLVARSEITVEADTDRVWLALTDPEQIKVYLYGTEAASDWQVGSPITYKGTWKGQTYEDKGTVLEAEPGRKLVSTYWSGMSGKEDKPENYVTVTYELSSTDGGTLVIITQDGNENEEAREQASSNWTMVLGSMKRLIEEA